MSRSKEAREDARDRAAWQRRRRRGVVYRRGVIAELEALLQVAIDRDEEREARHPERTKKPHAVACRAVDMGRGTITLQG